MKSKRSKPESSRLYRLWAPMVGVVGICLFPVLAWASGSQPLPGGELRIVGASPDQPPACPLKRTEVEAEIAGFVSRVRVRQHFENPLNEKIEAVYVFPLPQDAAVDSMTMTVGGRRIIGQIKPRDEARRVYDAARAAGHVAGLLDQERPNIFTQSLANIEPGAQVSIEITYVDLLRYEDGLFEFVFPMVVGPRYMPGMPVSHEGSGWAPDTTHVPDASRISPPPAVPGTRAGHDITLTVSLDAGTEVFDIASALHEVDTQVLGSGRARVTLRNLAEIPNRDFILRYRTATADIGDAFLVHEDERGRFFTLILQPPRRVEARQAVPKEMIFVIDRSGSMGGFPIEKAKETMRLAIEHMNPDDTFNLLSFSGGTGHCFEKPVPNTAENRAIALQYLADLHGSGGTEMMPAIHAALDGPADPRRIRIVAFMTDGYIGNDLEIVDAVRAQAGTARVFAFGIGNAVNRFLLDGMAHAGRGEVEYVTLNGQADAAAQRFQERIHSPVLTDITIDWEGLPVEDVYPKQIPDLFSSQPLMIHGRLAGPARGAVLVRGRGASGPFERRVRLQAAADAGVHPAVASLWARAAVDDLMNRDLTALQRGNFPDAIRAEIEHLGVEFHLMTQFTCFVAVEELTVTVGGAPRTVAVPVEMPEGVSYEGVFGSDKLVVMQGMVGGAMVPRSALRGQPAAVQEFAARDSRMDYLAEPRAALAPGAKLAEPLRDLAARVTKDGANGTLTVGTLRVVNYRVDVMIALRDVSKKTLEALRGLGFVQTGDSKAARILIGTIDVRQLLMLEALDTVVRVAPVA